MTEEPTFIVRTNSDRLSSNSTIGFQNDVHRNLYEKKKVALEQKQQGSEPNVFRIMKQFFAKCRDSGERLLIFMELLT